MCVLKNDLLRLRYESGISQCYRIEVVENDVEMRKW